MKRGIPKKPIGRTAEKRVLVFGVFDGVHPGHIHFLKQARHHGTHLTVVVTPDARVQHEKHRRAFFDQSERRLLVASLHVVDAVLLGDRGTRWRIIEKVKPDVICIGFDQFATHPEVVRQLRRLSPAPKIVRLSAYHRRRNATSMLRNGHRLRRKPLL